MGNECAKNAITWERSKVLVTSGAGGIISLFCQNIYFKGLKIKNAL